MTHRYTYTLRKQRLNFDQRYLRPTSTITSGPKGLSMLPPSTLLHSRTIDMTFVLTASRYVFRSSESQGKKYCKFSTEKSRKEVSYILPCDISLLCTYWGRQLTWETSSPCGRCQTKYAQRDRSSITSQPSTEGRIQDLYIVVTYRTRWLKTGSMSFEEVITKVLFNLFKAATVLPHIVWYLLSKLGGTNRNTKSESEQ